MQGESANFFVSDVRDLDMLRVWMLFLVGAAAMRQAAEDVSAHSSVKEEWNEEDEKRLRRDVETVAWSFGAEEGEHLTEIVMKAFENGELDTDLKKVSWRAKDRGRRKHILTKIMQRLRDKWQASHLRSAVEEVAKAYFPEKERHPLTEAVMKAFEKGDLYELKEMYRRSLLSNIQSSLLTTMERMQEDLGRLRRAVEEVAKTNFPKEFKRLAETVMEAFLKGELDQDWYKIYRTGFISQETMRNYLLKIMNKLRELPVAASAVKFCSEVFREANSKAWKSMSTWQSKLYMPAVHRVSPGMKQLEDIRNQENAKQKLKNQQIEKDKKAREEIGKAEGICHKVLTGELGPHDGPEWAEKAANSSQPDGQHYQLGRLQKVNATEKAWKVSLDNVCKDECIELVKEMRKETEQILYDVDTVEKPPSFEETCAKRVVQKVEAEILGCCAESCGWNGRACMYWPFLSSTLKGQWEAECCTEFNILKNSSRATMCDSTLTRKENKEVIRDEQPNTEEDREMVGQDPVLKGTSFFEREDTNGPSPPQDNKPIPAPERTCPPPLDLGKIHEKLKDEWKTTNFQVARKKNFKKEFCLQTRNDSIGNCTAFLPQDENGIYICFGHCLESVDGLELKNLTVEISSNSQLLYVHETIYKANQSNHQQSVHKTIYKTNGE